MTNPDNSSPSLEIHWTEFRSLYDTTPIPRSGRWTDFVGSMRLPLVTPDKHAAPMLSPFVYAAGTKRGNAGASSAQIVTLDHDHVTTAQFDAHVAHVERAGIAAFVHTTHSHAKATAAGEACARTHLLLERKVTPGEHRRIAEHLMSQVPAPSDQKCLDPGRAFFVPSCPPGAEALHVSRVFAGAPLDVDAVLRVAKSARSRGARR